MQQDKTIVIDILAKYQRHFRRVDVCRLYFSDLFRLLNLNQQKVLLNVCGLDANKLNNLDAQVPAKDSLINPYRHSPFARRFVRVTPILWDSFHQMSLELCRHNGKNIKIISGYRSPAYQSMLYLKELYKHNFDTEKTDCAIKLPGQSEHQDYKKLAIDIGDRKHNLTLSETSYSWLDQNAAKYNFLNSYKRENIKDDISFEPWHWRFIL